MDINKVTVVKQWLKPQTIKELKRFLGFAHFYRRFIRNYSSIAAPLISLLKGAPKKLMSNDLANTVFDQLREAFMTASILQHPDPEKPFIVEVDTSDIGV